MLGDTGSNNDASPLGKGAAVAAAAAVAEKEQKAAAERKEAGKLHQEAVREQRCCGAYVECACDVLALLSLRGTNDGSSFRAFSCAVPP